MTPKRATRRVGQIDQIDFQGRSHDATDCGTYRLVRRVGPSRWEVEWIASCDQPSLPSTVAFISRERYDRYF